MSVINAIIRAIGAQAKVLPAQLHGPIELSANRHLHLRGAPGTKLEALSGAIWVTQNGDIRDIVLEAGDAIVLDHRGEVVVSALSNATFRVASARVQSAESAPPGQRPASWLRASGDAVPAS